MPIAAPIAAALTDHSAHPWSLTVGGTDMAKLAAGAGFGVPIESIRVREVGPGGVSSIEFNVDDPRAETWIADVAPIELVRHSDGDVAFRGTVDHWESSPDFGGQGRTLRVTGSGPEQYLDDWTIVPPASVLNGTILADAIAYLANREAPRLIAPFAFGVISFPPASLGDGNADWPIGLLQVGGNNATVSGAWTWGGGTLRSAIADLAAHSVYIGAGNIVSYSVPILVTVDFGYRLRVWRDGPSFQPDDYTTLFVSDTVGSSVLATELSYAVEPGDVIHEVYVSGGGGVAGWFSDGTGITGRQGLISDATLTTFDAAAAAALNFLAAQAGKVRGSFRLVHYSPAVTTVHAGSLVSITDAASGSTGTYRIAAIAKTFYGNGTQDWTVEFGGLRPSVTSLTRRLTRAAQ